MTFLGRLVRELRFPLPYQEPDNRLGEIRKWLRSRKQGTPHVAIVSHRSSITVGVQVADKFASGENFLAAVSSPGYIRYLTELPIYGLERITYF